MERVMKETAGAADGDKRRCGRVEERRCHQQHLNSAINGAPCCVSHGGQLFIRLSLRLALQCSAAGSPSCQSDGETRRFRSQCCCLRNTQLYAMQPLDKVLNYCTTSEKCAKIHISNCLFCLFRFF